MNTYVSMLRGINVSGQKKIKMDELRVLYDSLGYAEVQSYIQSGNVVFQSAENDTAALEQQIHDAIQDRYGFDVPVQIRTTEQLQTVVDENPFLSGGRDEDIKFLYVTFLADEPDPSGAAEVRKSIFDHEEFEVVGRRVYIFVPKGFGRAKLNNNLLERKLKVSGTTRNWKTTLKLYDMATQMAT